MDPPATRYLVAIHHTPRGCYARVQNLPGCIARGASEGEALENLRETLRAYLAVARLMGQEEPRVRVEISA
jgi:predicted RNase H-like HicB family nuclease